MSLCIVLCRGLRQCGSHVDWLDLTCCDLTSTGLASVTALIRVSRQCLHSLYLPPLFQYHCLNRRRCAWEKSLRGGCPPRLSLMAGLHRVTLNLNPLISDSGVLDLASVLQDDLWIKGDRQLMHFHYHHRVTLCIAQLCMLLALQVRFCVFIKFR